MPGSAGLATLTPGRRITLPDVGLFADGTAVKTVGEQTFRMVKLYVDEIILVDTDQLCACQSWAAGVGTRARTRRTSCSFSQS